MSVFPRSKKIHGIIKVITLHVKIFWQVFFTIAMADHLHTSFLPDMLSGGSGSMEQLMAGLNTDTMVLTRERNSLAGRTRNEETDWGYNWSDVPPQTKGKLYDNVSLY